MRGEAGRIGREYCTQATDWGFAAVIETPDHTILFDIGGDGTTLLSNMGQLGIKKVAPNHCTGDKAIALFRQAWGDDFIEGGCGAIIEVPLSVAR